MKRFAPHILSALLFFGSASLARGAELYANTNGKIWIRDAQISSLNNNVITVLLWGTHWVFYVGTDAKVTDASGGPITVWQLHTGDNIYTEGDASDSGIGKIEIDVSLLRDLSIPGTGAPLAIPLVTPPTAISAPVQVPVPAPTSAPVPSSASGISSTSVVKAPSAEGLAKGAKGAAVTNLQNVLLGLGYIQESDVTGYFGGATVRAVMRLQLANGLPEEGSVGPLTQRIIAALENGSSASIPSAPPPSVQASAASPLQSQSQSTPPVTGALTATLSKGMQNKEVTILQQFLQKSGYGIPNDGPVTGFYGAVTEQAVKTFQEANGLEAVGSVGPQTRSLINKLLGN